MAARGFPYHDLQSFLTALEAAGVLRRVGVPVDPTLEISEIVTRTVRAGGPALLFERPTRGEMPVAINLFGTEKRMAMALGVESLNEIGDRIGALIKPELPVGWSGIREGLGKVLQLKSVPPRKVKSAPCQEIVLKGDEVDLNRLPGLQVWPGDGGIFHNYGLTHTKHPETGKRNLGLYRLQQHSRNTIGMHWQIHKDSTAHHAVAERRGERLPVAIAIGCDPVVSYAASAPLPGDIDEYMFAGFLRGERVEMVDCLTVPLQVPTHAQKVMNAIWGAHLLSLTKLIVVVDDDCDVHDYAEVAWRAFGNVDYAHDLLLTSGPVDHLDHASYQQFWGGKAGVDATRKLPAEGYHRGWPEVATMSPEVVSTVDRRWKEYGL